MGLGQYLGMGGRQDSNFSQAFGDDEMGEGGSSDNYNRMLRDPNDPDLHGGVGWYEGMQRRIDPYNSFNPQYPPSYFGMDEDDPNYPPGYKSGGGNSGFGSNRGGLGQFLTNPYRSGYGGGYE